MKFGRKEHRNEDWFEAHWDVIQPVTETKRNALLAYKQNPCPSTHDVLRAAQSKSQQTVRHCTNDYWLNLCSRIQIATNTENARCMYDGIKTVTGPTATKTAQLKSKTGEIITDQCKQLNCWMEHYLELYAIQNMVTVAALEALPNLAVMDDLDDLPTMAELGKAIDWLSSEKAPGRDGIPPEVLKSGKPTPLQHLHLLLCLNWKKGHVPQNICNANVVGLYKNRGERSDCNNDCGLYLLSIVGKVFVRVILTFLQSLAHRVYPMS